MNATDLKAIERFEKSDNHFKLTKLSSKRDNSAVNVGHVRIGPFSIYKWPKTANMPEAAGVMIGSLRTSPIVKVVDFGQDFTIFETEGGVYKLEKENKEQ